MQDLNALAWPVLQLGEAIAALARHSGLAPQERETPAPPAGLARPGAAALGTWIETTAAWLGLEAEPVETPYAEVEGLVRAAGPALLCLPGEGAPRFLALVGGRRRAVAVLGPDLMLHRLRPAVVRVALCRALEAPLTPDVERLLTDVGVPGRRRERTRQAILGQRLSAERLGGCWLLRRPAPLSGPRCARPACPGACASWLARMSCSICSGSCPGGWSGQGRSRGASRAPGCWPGCCSCSPWCRCACWSPGCRAGVPLASAGCSSGGCWPEPCGLSRRRSASRVRASSSGVFLSRKPWKRWP